MVAGRRDNRWNDDETIDGTLLDDETIDGMAAPAPRSSAAKEWIEELAQRTEKKTAQQATNDRLQTHKTVETTGYKRIKL